MLITDEEYIKIVNIFERDNAGRYLNDINASNEDGETLLYRLAAIGAVNLISLLVKLGCDINLPNNDGRTPVSIAVMKHHEDTVAKLVELGASLDTPDNDGRTIVHLAAITGDDHALKMLFKYNVKMDTVESLNGATPVFIAAYFNHENVLLRLLDQGVNIETPHMNGTTPLNIAAEKGFVAIMRHLIDNYAGADGANLEAYDEKGRTPVVAAAANDHLEAVKLLLENGADLNASTDSGSTALYIAASNGHVNIVRYLLRHFDIQIIPTYYSAKALEKLEGDDENKRIKIAKLIAAKLSVGFNIDCIPVYPYEIAEICGRDEVVLAFQEVPHTLTMYPSDPSIADKKIIFTDTQYALLKLGFLLGHFSKDPDGLKEDENLGACHGIMAKWMEASLLGEDEETAFTHYLNRIHRDVLLFKKITQAKENKEQRQELTSDEKELLGIDDLCKRMDGYQSPEEYAGPNGSLHQGDFDRVSLFAGSEKIKVRGGLAVAYSEPVIFTEREMVKYFDSLG